MTGDLVRRDTDDWVDILGAVGTLADNVYNTEFVPDGLRGKKAAVAACILAGREIGLGPMTSLQTIDVVEGKPTLNAEMQRSLVFAAGHRIEYPEVGPERVKAVGYRAGSDQPAGEAVFTIAQARQMNLVRDRSNWVKDPESMLVARATSRLCRRVFPDVIRGMGYTADEAAEGGDDQPPQTARRATTRRTAVDAPAPVLAAAPEPERPAAAQDGLDAPPLDDVEQTLIVEHVAAAEAAADSAASAAVDVGTGEIVDADIVEEEPPYIVPPDDPNPGLHEQLTEAMEAGVAARDPGRAAANRAAVRAVDADEVLAGDATLEQPTLQLASPEEGVEDRIRNRVPVDGGGGILVGQSKLLHKLFNDCGYNDRDDRLRASIAITAHKNLTSSNQLTKEEASELIEALEFCAASSDPQARLADLVQTATGGLL